MVRLPPRLTPHHLLPIPQGVEEHDSRHVGDKTPSLVGRAAAIRAYYTINDLTPYETASCFWVRAGPSIRPTEVVASSSRVLPVFVHLLASTTQFSLSSPRFGNGGEG